MSRTWCWSVNEVRHEDGRVRRRRRRRGSVMKTLEGEGKSVTS